MRQLITSARVRAIIADAATERDITDALRAHRIRYGYSTEGGYLHIRIPSRTGVIRVYRTAGRSAPPVFGPGAGPVPFRFPVLHHDN